MWRTSERFNEALHQSTRAWTSRLDVLYKGEKITLDNIIIEGTIDLDRVPVRRLAKIKITDPTGTLTPVNARDLLSPKGTEILPYRGLYMPPNKQVEWVPMGVFGITEPTITRIPGGGTMIEIDAPDRAAFIKVQRFIDPWRVSKGTKTTQAISDIVFERAKMAQRIHASPATTPEVVYDALSDPWDAIDDLASADSLLAYFDPVGTFVVAPDEPEHTGIVYKPGKGSMLLDTKRVITSDATYSGVVVRVEHPDNDPIVAKAWDNNPRSPTYHLGPFGKRPYGFSSHLITTQAQAQKAADTLLPKVTKMRQTIEILTVGHPGHDVGDLVTVEDPATKIRGQWVVVGGTMSLHHGAPTKLILAENMSNHAH